MARFLTLGYGDRAGYDRTADDVLAAAHAHDARLQADGIPMGVLGPPVQVRNHDAAGVVTEAGPFLFSGLPIAGFALVEAATLEEAVALVSRTPCAVARGVVEVWPVEDAPG